MAGFNLTAALRLGFLAAASLALFPSGASASGAFINQDLRDLTVAKSPINPDITISYKEPKGACNTALDTQKQITGWVNIPGEDYPIHLFFWFIEAREKTDLLSVWLNGGPGSSSMFGFFTGAGPCEVVEEGRRLTTKAREWGWDRLSNMLFIDQPNQVGFSYDTPTDGTVHMFNKLGYTTPPVSTEEMPQGNDWLVYNGTFSTNEKDKTANTTANAAEAIYHLMQGFLATFPQYNPPDGMPLGVNLFAESYGGKYAPVYATKWAEMNDARDKGEIPKNETVEVDLRSVGIVNGCIDDLVQAPFYPLFLYKSPYGEELITEEKFADTNASFYNLGGCRDAILSCRNMVAKLDPDHSGDSKAAAEECKYASGLCDVTLWDAPFSAVRPPRSWYDISALDPSPFPPYWYLEYVQTEEFNRAIGAATNFSMVSYAVNSAFWLTGDLEMQETIPQLAALLERGVRVSLLYGDRDYICNWMGGEAVSLAVAEAAGEAYNGDKFAGVGYADIQTNKDYIGGAVRQLGNLSFARVYQAGHALPSYQPETAFQLFARSILGNAMNSGMDVDLSTFKTSGSSEADEKLKLPETPEPVCWIRSVSDTCTVEHQEALLNQTGIIINGAHYFREEDWKESSTTNNEPNPTMTGGLYTGTPATEDGNDRGIAAGMAVPTGMIVSALVVAMGFISGGLGL